MNRIGSMFVALVCCALLGGFVLADQQPDAGPSGFLAQGYQAVENLKLDQARDLFLKAGDEALKSSNWQQLIDSGYALANIGQPGDGRKYINASYDIAMAEKSWQKLLASGYALSYLPGTFGVSGKAMRSFLTAGQISREQGSWKGLVQSGNALMSIGEKNRAAQFYDLAFELASTANNPQAFRELEECYTALNNYSKIAECRKRQGKAPAPTGAAAGGVPDTSWVGDSVAQPSQTPVDIQLAKNQRAAQRMQARDDYLLKQQEEKISIYSDNYYRYYGYPDLMFSNTSGYRATPYLTRQPWRSFNDEELVIWARSSRDRYY